MKWKIFYIVAPMISAIFSFVVAIRDDSFVWLFTSFLFLANAVKAFKNRNNEE